MSSSQQCQGITQKGVRCKNRTRIGRLCAVHLKHPIRPIQQPTQHIVQLVSGSGREYNVPSECLKPERITQITPLGSGSWGDVFTVCDSDGCKKVIKLQILDDSRRLRLFHEEKDLIQLADSLQIAPHLYDSWICPKVVINRKGTHMVSDVGFYLSEKYDDELERALTRGYQLNLSTVLIFVQKVKQLRNTHDRLDPDMFRGRNLFVKVSDDLIIKIVCGDLGTQDAEPMPEKTMLQLIRREIRFAFPSDDFPDWAQTDFI